MKVEEKVTIEFSPEDIIEILTESIKHKGYDVNSISFSLINNTKGQGMSEHNEKVFNGAIANCKVTRPQQFIR